MTTITSIKKSLNNNEKIGKLKGEYLGEKGYFFKFKLDYMNRLVFSFRYDEKTPSGLSKSVDGIHETETQNFKFNG